MDVKKIELAGYLGLVAALGVGAGEFLMHFSTEIPEIETPFGYFLDIPFWRLTVGHFLMIPFIPLYILGYWHLYEALKPGNHHLALAVLVLGIFAFVIGGIWVGSRAHLGTMLKILHEANMPQIQAQLVSSYELHMENLVQALRVIVVLISAFFVWGILNGNTLYPRWMVFFNPGLLLVLIFITFFLLRPVGRYLIPTAMNIAHAGLFIASLISLKTARKR